MQVSVEAGDGLTRQLTVELPAEEIEQEIDKRLQKYARTASLPGFRPGKVPLRELRRRFGEGLRREVFGEHIEQSYPKAILESDLRPAGRPEIEPDIDARQGRYRYTAKFEVFPEISLNSLSGKTVERPIVEVSEPDVDSTIERLRRQRTEWEPVERAAVAGDRVRFDYEGRVDGEPFEGGSGEDVVIELGAGRFVPGFEAQLEGAAAGEERAVEVTFPEDYRPESLAGRSAAFAVAVKEVMAASVPELDADFARALGVADGDLERFRADVRANLERELAERVKSNVKTRVLDALLDAHPIAVPDALVAEEIESLRQHMRKDAAGAEIELPDQLFTDNARRRVTLGLIVAEVVKQAELKPDPAGVRAAVEAMAATYEDPQQVIDYYYADQQRLAGIESMVLEDLLVEHLLGQMQVVDVATSLSELTES